MQFTRPCLKREGKSRNLSKFKSENCVLELTCTVIMLIHFLTLITVQCTMYIPLQYTVLSFDDIFGK